MPDWRAEIRRRVASLELEPAREASIVEELAAHLQDRYDELRARGATAAAAEAEVLVEHLSGPALAEALAGLLPPAPPRGPELGGGRTEGLVSGLVDDLRYAVRSLAKSPGFTAVALATLTLGIGANTTIFSAINGVLLRPPPFHEPSRLVTFWGTAPEKGLPVVNYPDALYAWYRERLESLDPIAMYAGGGFTLTGSEAAERLNGATVTVDFFRVLGIEPLLGRTFRDEEEARGANLVAVLSYGLWQRRFGGDAQILGRAVLLDNIPTTVVGVMPPGFTFPQRTELWIPNGIDPASTNCWCLDAIGRLARGRAAPDVAREIDALNADFWAEREGRPRPPPGEEARSTIVKPLTRELVGDLRTPLLVLIAAVGMVLLIACANLANLELARATARRREIAVRAAMGASPRRIARQLLTESLLLSGSGAALGLLAAVPAMSLLSRQAVERLPHVDRIGLDPLVLAFTALLGVATGVVFGFAPTVRGARVDLTASLKEASRTTGAGSSHRLNDAFVVAQLALSLVLLVGAGLLLRSFARLTDVDPGFEPRNVVVGRVSVPFTVYSDMAQVRELTGRLLERVAAIPGVTAAGVSSTAPFSSGDNQQNLVVQGQEPGPREPVPVASIRRVSAHYFQAVGTPILEGRAFGPGDRDGGERVAIIDRSLSERYWPGSSAVGRRISTGDVQSPVWRTVVGVATSIRHRRLDRAPDHYVYYPLEQGFAWTLDVVVRSTAAPAAVTRALLAEVSATDPNLPLYDVHTLEEAVDRSLATRRFTSTLLLGFAACALLIGTIGVFGVMARNVGSRVREFGVRLTLGAKPSQIEGLVLRRGARLVLLGAAIGMVGAAAVTRALTGLLYEIEPLDPGTYAVALLSLALVALAACWIPARRATMVDPLEAVRAE